ncbi:hypothetical protein AVEN_103803-1 [Araneus ventricosus]|uniref:Uncharacterized protein n=1 Tax=Araneus ventricosus TaxID=182803 RepID=A0A4Y2G645_ARAVE|nr:hypothetical protein AVEN_103803-1 [Araneus ventricosus]
MRSLRCRAKCVKLENPDIFSKKENSERIPLSGTSQETCSQTQSCQFRITNISCRKKVLFLIHLFKVFVQTGVKRVADLLGCEMRTNDFFTLTYSKLKKDMQKGKQKKLVFHKRESQNCALGEGRPFRKDVSRSWHLKKSNKNTNALQQF